jgi:LppX_LprAFG lipoprotein
MLKHTRASSDFNRKYAASFPELCVLFLILLFSLAACGDSTTTSVPDSQQLLNQARDAMKQVNSYHFNLATAHPGTGNGINIQTADGDALAPDKIKAKANVDLQGITAQVNIIAIGQKQYYTDPITGSWTPITGIIDPHVLADPQTGIGTILSHIRNPGKATDSSVDGTSCWSITGLLDSQYIAGITGSSQSTKSDVNTTVCIGKSDHYPYQMQINGVAIQGDGPQTARTIKFSKFNESITIQAPSA